jgi:hypothetical protein
MGQPFASSKKIQPFLWAGLNGVRFAMDIRKTVIVFLLRLAPKIIKSLFFGWPITDET